MIIIHIYVVDPFGETKGFTQYRQCQQHTEDVFLLKNISKMCKKIGTGRRVSHVRDQKKC